MYRGTQRDRPIEIDKFRKLFSFMFQIFLNTIKEKEKKTIEKY